MKNLEKEVYYKFLADISYGIVIDQEGYIYNTKNGQNSELLNGVNYNSGMSYDTYNGSIDLDGRPIDIIGNLE